MEEPGRATDWSGGSRAAVLEAEIRLETGISGPATWLFKQSLGSCRDAGSDRRHGYAMAMRRALPGPSIRFSTRFRNCRSNVSSQKIGGD